MSATGLAPRLAASQILHAVLFQRLLMSEAVAARLAKHGVMAGGGDFYGVRVIKAMGEDPDHGVLRMSFVHYTSKAEVDQLLTALEAEL